MLRMTDPSLHTVWVDPEAAPSPNLERMLEEFELVLSEPVERLGAGENLPQDSAEIGAILMAGRDSRLWLETLGAGAAGRWVSDHLTAGSLVFAAGAAAAVLGDRVFDDGVRDCQGLGWLAGAVLLPGASDPADDPKVRRYLAETDHSYALGLPEDTVLAIGPQRQIEVWSGPSPRLMFGRGWIPE
jgi:hypothetical protein